MSVQIASTFDGSVDEYLNNLQTHANKAAFLKKYAVQKQAKVLGLPSKEAGEEITKRYANAQQIQEDDRRAQRARFLKQLARLRKIALMTAAASIALTCPASAPLMCGMIAVVHLETKAIDKAADKRIAKGPKLAAVKQASDSLSVLRAVKKMMASANKTKNKEEKALHATKMPKKGKYSFISTTSRGR